MNFTGVIANAVSIVIGSLIGTLFGRKIPEKVGKALLSAMGLCILFIGISSVVLKASMIVSVISIAIGAVLGELIDFDAKLDKLGQSVQKKISSAEGTSLFSQGFVNSTLLVCMGAMSIVGSIESGMMGNPQTLLTKSIIDGTIMIVLSSTMGIGCALSAVPLFLYLGAMTVLSGSVAHLLTDPVITQMSSIGGILIMGVGLNMLDITKIKVGNLILAPFLSILLMQLPFFA